MNDKDWLRRKMRNTARGCAIFPAMVLGGILFYLVFI